MLQATHWDFVLTCFEPIGAVTGGIGTYSRALLAQLAGGHRRILFVTTARNEAIDAPTGVEVLQVPEACSVGGLPVTNLEDPHRQFSFNVMQQLIALQSNGATFGVLEVPDYGAEGYFAAKARAFGLLRINRIVVRLHSPEQMLDLDNDSRARVDHHAYRRYDEIRAVYRHCDAAFFGTDAMLDRVEGLLPPGQASPLRAKAIKVPHPWPEVFVSAPPAPRAEPGRPVEVGFVGRLEYRKGVDLLVLAALRALPRIRQPVRFHFFGRDTATFRGGSARAALEALIPPEHAGSFVFHDYQPQARLWRELLPGMDLFVFPSRFENHPNVLLETLALGRPILVSRHGGMPEIAADFPGVHSFSPEDEAAFAQLLVERVAAAPERAEVGERWRSRREDAGRRISACYEQLFDSPPPSEPARDPLPRLSFVVAHYQHARWLPALLASIRAQWCEGDELVVVDDCSAVAQVRLARTLVEGAGGRFLQTGVNSGPSVARNLGAKESRNQWLYFVDADDELAPGTVSVLRGALARRPELQVVSGFLEAFGDERHCWAGYDPSPATILAQNSAHAGLVISRELFERVGGYQTAQRLHFEDWELNMRLALAGACFEIAPLVTYRYRTNRKDGRNFALPEQQEHSKESALRHALQGIDPSALRQAWPELSEVMIGLLMRAARAPPPLDALRYRLADSVNSLLKKTPLHSALKWAFRRAGLDPTSQAGTARPDLTTRGTFVHRTGIASDGLPPTAPRPTRPPDRFLALAASVLTACLGAWITVAVFFPGYMSVDSLLQLGEGRSGYFRDLHPPVMSWLLGLFDKLWRGPQGYLIFQCLIFWLGLALIVHQLFRRQLARSGLVLALGLSPPIFALLGTVWKDVLLGSSLVLATGLLFRFQSTKERWTLVASVPCFFLAAAARHNSVVALWPLMVWMAAEVIGALPTRRHGRWAVAGLSVLLAASFWGAASLVSSVLTNGNSVHSEQQILVFDLAAVSVARDTDLMPEYFRRDPAYSFARVKTAYWPDNVCGLMFCPGAPCPMTSDRAQLDELRSVWRSTVLRYPSEWLQHRVRMYKFLLSVGTETVIYPFHGGVEANELGVALVPSKLNAQAMTVLDRVRNSLLFRGWIYLALLALFAAMSLRMSPELRSLALATSTSGLAYGITYLFLAPVPDFRLLWWCVVATAVCAATALAQFVRSRSDGSRTATKTPA